MSHTINGYLTDAELTMAFKQSTFANTPKGRAKRRKIVTAFTSNPECQGAWRKEFADQILMAVEGLVTGSGAMGKTYNTVIARVPDSWTYFIVSTEHFIDEQHVLSVARELYHSFCKQQGADPESCNCFGITINNAFSGMHVDKLKELAKQVGLDPDKGKDYLN